MLSFKPNRKITDPKILFGRNKPFQQLEKVINNIYRGTNCQLQGERRFGKSSILNCVHSLLIEDKKTRYIPQILNLKEHPSISGTTNVYRYIISCFARQLATEGLFNHELTFRARKLRPSIIAEDIFQQLSEIEDIRVEGIIEDFILYFSKEHSINFVLLIDEYEHLLARSLTDPVGFMLIRSLSDEHFGETIPLTYVIAGSKEWNALCTQIGSPELNNQGAGIIYVGSINEADFSDMFDYYCSPAELKHYPHLNKAELYSLSGGIPYYAKKLAETIITGGNASEQLLDNDFKNILDNLDSQEQPIIQDIIAKQTTNGNVVLNLIDRGILKKYNGVVQINGSLLDGFFRKRLAPKDTDSNNAGNNVLESLTNEIFSLIENINRNCRAKGLHSFVFEPTIAEYSIRLSLLTQVKNEAEFAKFINTVYQILLEKTKINGRKKGRLPAQFINDPAINRIDSLRQEFHHLTHSVTYNIRRNQFSRSTLFQHYLGTVLDPTEKDFPKLQFAIMEEFKQFLHEVRKSYS